MDLKILEDSEMPEGYDVSTEEPAEYYCSVCGRKIVTSEGLLNLITVQRKGKRYTGVICDYCSDDPENASGERVIAMQILVVEQGFCIRAHDH
jgi:DNA-directed RNA polymerase subunit RPC12/RpoP